MKKLDDVIAISQLIAGSLFSEKGGLVTNIIIWGEGFLDFFGKSNLVKTHKFYFPFRTWWIPWFKWIHLYPRKQIDSLFRTRINRMRVILISTRRTFRFWILTVKTVLQIRHTRIDLVFCRLRARFVYLTTLNSRGIRIISCNKVVLLWIHILTQPVFQFMIHTIIKWITFFWPLVMISELIIS